MEMAGAERWFSGHWDEGPEGEAGVVAKRRPRRVVAELLAV